MRAIVIYLFCFSYGVEDPTLFHQMHCLRRQTIKDALQMPGCSLFTQFIHPPSIPNTTFHSDSSLALIKTPTPLINTELIMFFNPLINQPTFWGQIMTLPRIRGRAYYSCFSCLQLEDIISCNRLDDFWLCSVSISFQQAAESEEFEWMM